MWQDWMISILQWVFIVSLLPTIFHATHKPPISTSLIAGIGLLIMSATYLTLELYVSTFSSLILGVLWIIVAYQRYRLNWKNKTD